MRPFGRVAAKSCFDTFFFRAVEIPYGDVVLGQRVDLAWAKYNVAPKCKYAAGRLAIRFGTFLQFVAELVRNVNK